MERIIKQLFGFATDNRQVYGFRPGVKTIVPKNRPSEQKWIDEFRLGIAYGKSSVHFG